MVDADFVAVAEKTLNAANTATSVLNTFFVVVSIVLAAIAVGIMLFGYWLGHKFNKEKIEAIKEAKTAFLAELAKNSDIKNELINHILKNKDFSKTLINLPEFKEKLDICVADQAELLLSQGLCTKYVNKPEAPDSEDKDVLKNIDIKIDNEKNLKEQ